MNMMQGVPRVIDLNYFNRQLCPVKNHCQLKGHNVELSLFTMRLFDTPLSTFSFTQEHQCNVTVKVLIICLLYKYIVQNIGKSILLIVIILIPNMNYKKSNFLSSNWIKRSSAFNCMMHFLTTMSGLKTFQVIR